MYLERLSGRFAECINEKNGTLIRYDIIVGFRQLYEATGDASVKTRALELIETEEDLKYRKKYAGVWKKPKSSYEIASRQCDQHLPAVIQR